MYIYLLICLFVCLLRSSSFDFTIFLCLGKSIFCFSGPLSPNLPTFSRNVPNPNPIFRRFLSVLSKYPELQMTSCCSFPICCPPICIVPRHLFSLAGYSLNRTHGTVMSDYITNSQYFTLLMPYTILILIKTS
uniref:Secreted protein n=1 Tax=Mus musculus TaxID=10090 RepID=Q3TZB4_MOUSE|nr:unnamed protein product [Mus musculus]